MKNFLKGLLDGALIVLAIALILGLMGFAMWWDKVRFIY